MFLCNLAQAKGFKRVVLLLERVWARASRGQWPASRIEFRKARALPMSTQKFFVTHEIGEEVGFDVVLEVLCQVAFALLTPELLSVGWVLFFLLQLDMGGVGGGVDEDESLSRCHKNLYNFLTLDINTPSLAE